ncbi:hypothetical protein A5764_16160 [Mycobacterium sp. 852002-51057_SCH5723018]|nr:hypothetical protein A5764_16160 [Mycobacterium sp. 852002-51057_SCH5723018]
MLSVEGLCQETLEEAETFLASRADLPSFADLDSVDGLARSSNAQLALLIAGTACARALLKRGVPDPDVVAGHSVGACSAAVLAGALLFTEALDTVALRASEMERVCAAGRWGMTAVDGVDARTAEAVAREVGSAQDPLWVANVNSRRQVVFSGSWGALNALDLAAEHAGAQRVRRLGVSVASHGALLKPVRDALADHLAAVPPRPLRAAYLTNTRGRRTQDSHAVLADLIESVAQPVQWRTIAEILPELGVTHAVEMLPGDVLTRLTDSPDIHVMSTADLGLITTMHRLTRSRRSRGPSR